MAGWFPGTSVSAVINWKQLQVPTASVSSYHGWELHESGPSDTRHTVLLLPGAMASHVFFEDVAAEPRLNTVRLVATTLPGYAGTPPPLDDSVEAYAGQAGKLAADLGADVVVGHSVGANVAIEMGLRARSRDRWSCSLRASRAKTSRSSRVRSTGSRPFSVTCPTRSS